MKKINIFGKSVSLALILMITATTLTGAAAIIIHFWVDIDSNVMILGNAYELQLFSDEECTAPVTMIQFPEIMENDYATSVTQTPTYYMKLTNQDNPVPADTIKYKWAKGTTPFTSADFTAELSKKTGEVWGTFNNWVAATDYIWDAGHNVIKVRWTMDIIDEPEGDYDFIITLIAGDF